MKQSLTHLKTDVPELYNFVVKSNYLIQKSSFALSAQQQKIMLYIISQIEPSDDDFKFYEFKITDFCRITGIEAEGNIYKALRDNIESIAKKFVWIESPEGNSVSLRWIDKIQINKTQGLLSIRLDEDLKPYLLNLKSNFTKYELIYALNLKSKYAIRLYEYLKSILYDKRTTYKIKMSIAEFYLIFNSNYQQFKSFNTRVLQPAYKEINEKTDLIFDYELIKKFKKVEEIKITVSQKPINESMKITAAAEKKSKEKRGNA